MNNSHVPAGCPSNTARHLRQRIVTQSVALPASPYEALELRDLLEANLRALHALHEEHQRMLELSLEAIDGACAELRADLRSIGDARAPWVKALAETLALLFVALRELITGGDDRSVDPAPADSDSAR